MMYGSLGLDFINIVNKNVTAEDLKDVPQD